MTTSAPGTRSLLQIFKSGEGSKDELYEFASLEAKRLVDERTKHHQLRNLLDYVISAKQSHTIGQKELSPESKGRIATLRPRMAYMAARQKELLKLQASLDPVMKEAIQTPEDLNRLYDFVAALVAYHKFWDVSQQQTNQRAGGYGGRR